MQFYAKFGLICNKIIGIKFSLWRIVQTRVLSGQCQKVLLYYIIPWKSSFALLQGKKLIIMRRRRKKTNTKLPVRLCDLKAPLLLFLCSSKAELKG